MIWTGVGGTSMTVQIDHVIVLVLENRSFDHLLGYLPSDDPDFEGLTRGGPYENPGWNGGPAQAASPTGKHVLPVDPDHSHDAVMLQLGVSGRRRTPTNQGFIDSYERKGRGLSAPAFDGLLAPAWNLLQRDKPANTVSGRGPLIMHCQPPGNIPVLATLAQSFGVCSRWFASVPGETWPNRNFLHAATSDGTTNIEPRFYENRTIFEVLEDAGKSWRIYYDDTPQVWAFPKLWSEGRSGNWFRSSEFAAHVASGSLPSYSFIEPNHRPPLHATPFVHVSAPHGHSNSQHPGNNQVADADYDRLPANGPGDFARGESLIAQVYEALRTNPDVFRRSVLLVTYDEHGGFYDHVPPPTAVPAPGGPPRPGVTGWLIQHLLRRKSESFDFTMLGVRVPALVISPFVPIATVDATVRDHASVPATLREVFAPGAAPLTARDAWAPTFTSLLSLTEPRDDLPDLSGRLTGEPVPAPVPVPAVPAAAAAGPPPAGPSEPEPPVSASYQDLLALAGLVDERLPGPLAPADLGPRARGRHITAEFDKHAQATRDGR